MRLSTFTITLNLLIFHEIYGLSKWSEHPFSVPEIIRAGGFKIFKVEASSLCVIQAATGNHYDGCCFSAFKECLLIEGARNFSSNTTTEGWICWKIGK